MKCEFYCRCPSVNSISYSDFFGSKRFSFRIEYVSHCITRKFALHVLHIHRRNNNTHWRRFSIRRQHVENIYFYFKIVSFIVDRKYICKLARIRVSLLDNIHLFILVWVWLGTQRFSRLFLIPVVYLRTSIGHALPTAQIREMCTHNLTHFAN